MRILGVISSSSRERPGAPTIGTATDVGTGRAYNNGAATVTFTAPTYDGGFPITSYTVTASSGGYAASGSSSPITVTGLQSGVSYTFTVTATNAIGTSSPSAISNTITATTVPQAPTIGTATDGGTGTTVSVTFTPGANGGKAVSTYTATSSPSSITGTNTASPIMVSGLTTGTAYTFTVTALNANGSSTASAASNSVTPVNPTSYESIATISPTSGTSITFSSIPQTYKHLQIRAICKFNQTNVADYTVITGSINGVALTKSHELSGTGSTVTASSQSNYIGYMVNNHSSFANIFSPLIVDIHDYSSTSKTKVIRAISGIDTNNAGSANIQRITLMSAFRDNTAAVSSVTLSVGAGVAWVSGTTFALYGIKG